MRNYYAVIRNSVTNVEQTWKEGNIFYGKKVEGFQTQQAQKLIANITIS